MISGLENIDKLCVDVLHDLVMDIFYSMAGSVTAGVLLANTCVIFSVEKPEVTAELKPDGLSYKQEYLHRPWYLTP